MFRRRKLLGSFWRLEAQKKGQKSQAHARLKPSPDKNVGP